MAFYPSFIANFSPGSAGGLGAVTESRELTDSLSSTRDSAATIREQYGLVGCRGARFSGESRVLHHDSPFFGVTCISLCILTFELHLNMRETLRP
jgi:hypothetical protein